MYTSLYFPPENTSISVYANTRYARFLRIHCLTNQTGINRLAKTKVLSQRAKNECASKVAFNGAVYIKVHCERATKLRLSTNSEIILSMIALHDLFVLRSCCVKLRIQ